MKRYIKSSTQEYPDIFTVGDKIIIPLEGISPKTATCVQVSGRRNNRHLFVFDGTVGTSSMTNMDTFLDNLYDRFPENLSPRLGLIRLLQASEVFSDCDDPNEWEDLVRWGAEIHGPQIDYFRSVNHRISEDENWWWLNDKLPGLQGVSSSAGFSLVYFNGAAYYHVASSSLGVRPAFLII